MKNGMRSKETAIGMFYAAGVVLGVASFLSIGLLTDQWAPALFACIGGGLGFGLIMHGVLSIRGEKI